MKKQPLVTEKTKQVFLNAFVELYKEKPLNKISILELTQNAGYNRSTFYQYFKDIYDLLEYFEDGTLDIFSQHLLSEINQNLTVNPLTLIDKMIAFYEEYHFYMSAVTSPHAEASTVSKITALLTQTLQIPENDLKGRLILEFHQAGVFATLNFLSRHQNQLTTEEIREVLHGLLTEGSFKTILNRFNEVSE